MNLRSKLVFSLASLVLALPTLAGSPRTSLELPPREASFPVFERYVLDPWFDAEKEEWFDGAPAEIGPVRLRYKAFLSPDSDANLIVIHGYGERFEKYKEFIYDAQRQGFNVFYMEQRGFARSSRVNPQSSAVYVAKFEDYAEDMSRFMAQVVDAKAPGLQKFVFAHSMGGLVAAQLMKKNPGLIRAAVLSSPMLDPKTPLPPALLQSVGSLFVKLGMAGEYAFSQKPAGEERFPDAHTTSEVRWKAFSEFNTQEKETDYRVGGASFRWIAESLRASREAVSSAYAESIKTPMLMFQAERDSLINPEGQTAFCKAAPHCERIFVPNAKHEIYRETDQIRLPYLQKVFAFYEDHGKSRSRRTRLASP